MNRTRIVAIDLAKNVFQVCEVVPPSRVVKNVTVKRSRLLAVIRQYDPATTLIAMEACGSSNYWGREFQALGFEVRLVPAQHVKAFTRVQKHDSGDALAIAEACQRPGLHSVPVKTLQQQDLALRVRARERLVANRTALINVIRCMLAEYGIVVAKSFNKVFAAIPDLLEDPRLTSVANDVLASHYAELVELNDRIDRASQALEEVVQVHPDHALIRAVPGVGPVVAGVLIASIGNAAQFQNGRQLAAWAGLVPRCRGSGGKNVLGKITKNGDRSVRTALIHGARAVFNWRHKHDDAMRRWIRVIAARRGDSRAIVALANKLARIVFRILHDHQPFDLNKAFA